MNGRAMMIPAQSRLSGARRMPMPMQLGRLIRLITLSLALSVVPAAIGLLSGCGSCISVTQEDGDAGPATTTTPDPVKNQDKCRITDIKNIQPSKQRNIEIRLALPEGVKVKSGAVPELFWTGVRCPIRIKGGRNAKATIETTDEGQFVVAEAAVNTRGTFDLLFRVEDESGECFHDIPFKVDAENLNGGRRGVRIRPKGKSGKAPGNLGLLGEL